MIDLFERLLACNGFDWDEGNVEKNWIKHRVTTAECEEVFFNKPLWVAIDKKHSSSEHRYFALGKTEAGRHLFVVFTIRGQFIRVISARDMSKRERTVYDGG